MVELYGDAVDKWYPVEEWMSLSRRGLEHPEYRITRSSRLPQDINPWKERHRLPLLRGGFLAEVLYSDRPWVLENLEVPEGDPAYAYLSGLGAMFAMPMYDGGRAINMTILFFKDASGLRFGALADMLWRSNLFGRGTLNLVLRQQLADAYERIDEEFRVVGELQRSLLPRDLPEMPGLRFASFYRTSARAGGDSYDIFPLPDGKCGLFVADVSGHGAPAAVMMAVTHAIAHTLPGQPLPPEDLLRELNDRLASGYTGTSGTFVTAFYGVFDPATKMLEYACAGHNPGRVVRSGEIIDLDGASGLPLGVLTGERFARSRVQLHAGDKLVLYTDGITEAMDGSRRLFGLERLDEVLRQCRSSDPDGIAKAVVAAVQDFSGKDAPADDQTLLIAQAT